MGGRFRREGIYVCLWLIPVDVWQKPTQYYKAIIFQLKINKLKEKVLSVETAQVSISDEWIGNSLVIQWLGLHTFTA